MHILPESILNVVCEPRRKKQMNPVGVGRGLLGSYARIVEQEIQDQKKRRMLSNHQIGKKGLIARFLLGIKF